MPQASIHSVLRKPVPLMRASAWPVPTTAPIRPATVITATTIATSRALSPVDAFGSSSPTPIDLHSPSVTGSDTKQSLRRTPDYTSATSDPPHRTLVHRAHEEPPAAYCSHRSLTNSVTSLTALSGWCGRIGPTAILTVGLSVALRGTLPIRDNFSQVPPMLREGSSQRPRFRVSAGGCAAASSDRSAGSRTRGCGRCGSR